MKIGFDAKRAFMNATGLGTSSRNLLRILISFFPNDEFHLYTPVPVKSPLTEFLWAAENVHIHHPTSFLKRKIHPVWRSFILPGLLKTHKLDVYHGWSNELPIGISNVLSPSIVTIHDLIHLRFPSDYPVADRLVFTKKVEYACKHAMQVTAMSESTKRDLVELVNLNPEQIEVVYQNCDPVFSQRKSETELGRLLYEFNLPNKFILFVGSITQRKNLLSLVRAIHHLDDKLKFPLVVVGEGKAYRKKVEKYIKENNLSEKVLFRSTQSSQKLAALYQKAKLFIYPSIYEGYGIPIFEALCSGTPVLTGDNSSLMEAGGPGQKYIDVTDPEKIAISIMTILDDVSLQKSMIEAGARHTKNLTDEKIANHWMSIYKKTARLK